MNRLQRYRQLPPQHRRVLRQAILLVVMARLLLWSSLEVARKLLPIVARYLKAQSASPDLEVEAWAVNMAGAFVPHSTCLVKALALYALLERYGEPTQLHIGVAKGSNDQLLAHAWVQWGDRILVGGDESGDYTTLLLMK